jgi:signal peptidase I
MEPNLKQGDLLLLHSVNGSSAGIGDIVAFHRGDRGILHRVIEKKQSENGEIVLVTKGDNNRLADPPIKASEVDAKLLFRMPLLGSSARALGLGGGFEVYRYTVVTLALFWLGIWALQTRRAVVRRSAGLRKLNRQLTSATLRRADRAKSDG